MKSELKLIRVWGTLFISLICVVQSYAQNKESLKVFLDCRYCDITYIKQNLNQVEFVRDKSFADVYLFFRRQSDGSGGHAYEVEFIGQNKFSHISYKSNFTTKPNSTNSEVRDIRLEKIKIGLVRFWIENGDQDNISIQVKKREGVDTIEKDPWNKWVFNLSVNGSLSGQETSSRESLRTSIGIRKVTEKNKLYIMANMNNNKSTFEYDESSIVSHQKSSSIRVYDVISISNKFSIGMFSSIGKSTYNNKAFYLSIKPAAEYNLFPYEEYSKKQIRLSYSVGIINNDYFEKTIFGKEKEFLWEHNLSLAGGVNQTWGSINGEIVYQSYLHNLSLNAFIFNTNLNIRLFKGLSFSVRGNYRIVNNQINLAARDLSLEELLLRQQQVKSTYSYSLSLGLSYSFGSIYNTVVNPRFNF